MYKILRMVCAVIAAAAVVACVFLGIYLGMVAVWCAAAAALLFFALCMLFKYLQEEKEGKAEEGALSACRGLRSLTLPFVGNTVFVDAADYCGDLGVLFGLSDEREYDVPETLVSVKVLGGRLRGFAFSGCSSLTEIDACGIPAFAVSRQAFLGCGALQKIHTARADIVCPEGFVSERAACGCFVYSRAD